MGLYGHVNSKLKNRWSGMENILNEETKGGGGE